MKAPEGTAAGATTGGVIGGVLGWLAGIGILAVPGIGPLVAAGPIVAALTGVGVGGAGIRRFDRHGHSGICSQAGATDIASTGEAAADWQKTDKPLPCAS